ncbi:MAG TPA: hypothetical protein DCZ10_13260 [Pelotomaculum sp.]|nr:hypothetical protein [Pelotomaculum sp.]
MKRHCFLSMLLSLVFCLAVTNAAFGETQTSAKQLFLTDLKNNDIVVSGIPYHIYSGTSVLEIEEFKTNLPDSETAVQLLTRARLKLDSKVDGPAEKMETKYTLTLGGKNRSGSLFMDSDKMIVSTEFMDLIKDLYQAPDPSQLTLPRYVYFTGLADAGVWDSMVQPEISPALEEMLLFIFEAIPEHYYQLSPAEKTIKLQIDRNGLPEVIRSLTFKAIDEPERFAGLVFNILTAFDPTISEEDDNQGVLEILGMLEDLKEVVDTPDSPDQMLEMLGDKLTFNLVIESSLLPAGPDKFLFELGMNDLGTSTNIRIDSTTQGGKENISGTGLVSFNLTDKTEGFSLDGKISQDLRLTKAEYRTNCIIDFNFSESSDEDSYLLLSLKGTDRYKPEKSVAISLPELTPENSMDLTEVGNKPALFHEEVQVVLDGEALSFDVDPLIQEGRTMVPIRDLAEKLGFTVVWSEPNQVVMTDGDTTISIFLGEQTYTVNGTRKHLDVTPFASEGRVMVPVRFIAEELGCMVYYSEATNTVFINHKASTRVIP